MDTQNQKLRTALEYNSRGFSVIPIRPGSKIPIPTGWQRYSTTRSTRVEIEQWWRDVPEANIGIALGPANGDDGRHLFVVDQDVLKDDTGTPLRNEDGSFKQKGDIRGCPPTVSQTTGSGGKQFFYWAPLGYHVGNPKPRPLIDIKGFGGQVLVPPSVHPNGNSYAWDIDALSHENISEFPQDALDALLGERARTAPSVNAVLAGVPVGAGLRHMAIAQVAGFFLGRARTPEEIEMARIALYAWDREKNNSPEPWGERKRELDNTFEGILAKELAKPVRNLQQSRSSVSPSSKPVYACFDSIRAEKIQWLWPQRFAVGKLSLIVGDPSVGKSLLTATIAAIVSRGYEWPVDKISAEIGDVVLLSAEDDPADTTKPRLDAAEADSRRVHTLQAIRDVNDDGTPTQRMFSLKRDLDALEEMLVTLPECRLVVVDPISAYLDETDSHRNAAVRGLLGPLAALAAKRRVAIVAIDHLNKNSNESNTLYRPGGSLAFVAAARAAYVVTRDKENPNRRLIVPIKNNIAAENTGLAYTVITAENGAPVIVWEPEAIKITAIDALTRPDSNEERTDTDWAVLFLQDLLENGRMLSSEVIKEAKATGISHKSLRRAQGKLGVKPYKDKSVFNGPWWWSLPGHEDVSKIEEAPSKEVDILDTKGQLHDSVETEVDENSQQDLF